MRRRRSEASVSCVAPARRRDSPGNEKNSTGGVQRDILFPHSEIQNGTFIAAPDSTSFFGVVLLAVTSSGWSSRGAPAGVWWTPHRDCARQAVEGAPHRRRPRASCRAARAAACEPGAARRRTALRAEQFSHEDVEEEIGGRIVGELR